MELLNLSKCKTNADVCKLVSERVNSVPYTATFGSREKIYIPRTGYKRYLHGLSENMNVFLSGLAVTVKVT
jgi:hypothetical protein